MKTVIEGKAHIFGKNISTDQIYPGQYLDLVEPADIAAHCLEGADKDFASTVEEGDIVIATSNFGCGSSREHAATTLVEAGVGCVIAESFARIFFRNAINLALPLITCRSISDFVKTGDRVQVDIATGIIQNLTQGTSAQGDKLSDYVMSILEKGGIKEIFREKTGERKRK